MNALDVAVVGVLALSVGVGVWRGFVVEFFSLLAWGTAIIMGWLWGEPVGAAVAGGRIANPYIQWLVGAVVLAFLVFVVSNLVRSLLVQFFRAVGLDNFDRFLGAFFGLVRGVAIVWLGAKVLLWLGAGNSVWWQEARTRPYLEEGIAQLATRLPAAPSFQKKVEGS
ncbi:MAG: CvpA family protein [Hydrogenophilus sp.]|nr:CvpA family protein [Hydrogenophilus sp.]